MLQWFLQGKRSTTSYSTIIYKQLATHSRSIKVNLMRVKPLVVSLPNECQSMGAKSGTTSRFLLKEKQ